MKGTKAYPVGAGTYSKHPSRYADGAPGGIDWADGAYVGTDEGGRWVDLTSGMGAVILGHGHVPVAEAILHQLGDGIAFPLPNQLEEQVVKQLLGLVTWPKAESVRFGKNGADVTSSAVRLARAVTGRTDVLYCDYHGHHDWCMIEAPWNKGVPGWTGTVKVPRDEVVSAVLSLQPAAVVLEPWPSAPSTWGPASNFWTALREACDIAGTLLILDEMVSGFRAAPGGGAEFFGIEPDLACYGKAMANGMPLSAVVGPYEYLKRYEEDVFFSLTHAGEALSLAAASATMEALKDGRALHRVAMLGQDIIGLFLEVGDVRIRYGYPQRLLFPGFGKKELGILLDHGVLCAGYANLTLAHAEDPVARCTILDAFHAVLNT